MSWPVIIVVSFTVAVTVHYVRVQWYITVEPCRPVDLILLYIDLIPGARTATYLIFLTSVSITAVFYSMKIKLETEESFREPQETEHNENPVDEKQEACREA